MREDSLLPSCRHLFFPLVTEPGYCSCGRCGGSASADWVRGWMVGQMVGKVRIPDPKTGPNVYIIVDETEAPGE